MKGCNYELKFGQLHILLCCCKTEQCNGDNCASAFCALVRDFSKARGGERVRSNCVRKCGKKYRQLHSLFPLSAIVNFFFVLHFFFCENLVSFRTSIFGVSTPIAKASLAYFLGVRVTCLNFSDPGFRKFERTEHICFSEFSKYCAL